jgi:TfoX N-terminal domain
MAYSERLADRIRKLLPRHASAAEIKMMGGLCFTLGGHMCCGVIKDDLVVRVGAERHREVLSKPHVRPMDFTGRPLKGFVFVSPAGHRNERSLKTWVGRATDFVESLPPKTGKRARLKKGVAG